jgi:hypothetical protein
LRIIIKQRLGEAEGAGSAASPGFYRSTTMPGTAAEKGVSAGASLALV